MRIPPTGTFYGNYGFRGNGVQVQVNTPTIAGSSTLRGFYYVTATGTGLPLRHSGVLFVYNGEGHIPIAISLDSRL